MLRFASLPIRRAGTLGGNLANGSPIGDSAPVLMALDAVLVLQRGEQVRRLPLHGFYTGYLQNQLQPGEFLQAIEVPRAAALGRTVRAYKISKRFDCDIGAVRGLVLTVAGGPHRRSATGLWRHGRHRAARRRSRSRAAGPALDRTHSAGRRVAALAQDFTPLSDMRASSSYRLQVAQNLLRRFWETRPVDPLPATATSVWAREGEI